LKNKVLILAALVIALLSLIILTGILLPQDEVIVVENKQEKDEDELPELKAEVGLVKTDWCYFTFELEVPENIQDGEDLTLKFLSYLGEGDETIEDNIIISLKFKSD
jgi:hypothetical protein